MESNMLFPYLFGFGLSFLIGVLITRAIFSIPTFLRLQRAQLHLLSEIAKVQGVNSEVIKSIYNNTEVEMRSETNTERNERLEREKAEKQV